MVPVLCLCLPLAQAVPVPAAHVSPGQQVVRIKDPAITESSGLLARDGEFFTVNDSGGDGVVYVIDAVTGRTARTIDFARGPRDVEALAFGASAGGGPGIWVGDIGDNDAVRPWISVTSVSPGVAPRRYRLSYPDGAVDAEALLVNPITGRLFIASKEFFGGTLYAAPGELRRKGTNLLAPVAEVGSVVTDGSFFPDGKHVILRGYVRATVYRFPSMKAVGSFALPREPQGEGIAVSPAGKVFVSSEGSEQPILAVELPARVTAALAGKERSEGFEGAVTRARDEVLDETSWLPGGPWTAGGLVLVVLAGFGLLLARRRAA